MSKDTELDVRVEIQPQACLTLNPTLSTVLHLLSCTMTEVMWVWVEGEVGEAVM